LHRLNSTFVLGYHGCDQEVADAILVGKSTLNKSTNDYDWLGHGIYFWEANPLRGLEYARELADLRRGPRIRKPCVIGAVIDLGLCLDTTSAAAIAQVQEAHRQLVKVAEAADRPLPANSGDMLRRSLDCAVIEYLHTIRESNGDTPLDSVRGVFTEGQPIYPTSGFMRKTHVQICVRTQENIKGVFRVDQRYLK